MKWNRQGFYRAVDNITLAVLGILILTVVILLAASVARQSGLDAELQGTVEDLKEAAADLHDAVDALRASTDDPALAVGLEAIDDRLEDVEEHLAHLEENVDQPAGEPANDEESAQDNFDDLLRATSWLLGILSIVTAAGLAKILHQRLYKRRPRLRIPDPADLSHVPGPADSRGQRS